MMEDDSPNLFGTDNNGLFFFETDHLALKGNKEYCEVLKTVVTLTAIREKAIKDYKKIIEIKQKVLGEPCKILEKCQNGERMAFEIPSQLEIPKLPIINFDKFDVKISEDELATIYSDKSSCNKQDDNKIKYIDNSTNNRAWTPEEQKRLEELLLVYPPEPVEMRRFQKIAAALGNKTANQVSSRVQKYFLKLFKAGLPIPGRIPKSCEKYKKSLGHKHHRYNHYLLKPSTFFPDLYVPVTMNDDLEHTPGPSGNPPLSTSNCSNYLLPSEYYNQSFGLQSAKTMPEMQLALLKRIKAEKSKEQDENYQPAQHLGFKCDYCETEPILGSRWHCLTCVESIDFCTDCVLSQIYSSEPHPLKHILAVYCNDMDGNPSIPSDSESHSGSFVTNVQCDSDSNCSEDLDYGDNSDNFVKIQSNYRETTENDNESDS